MQTETHTDHPLEERLAALADRRPRGDAALFIEKVRADLWSLRSALPADAWQAAIGRLRGGALAEVVLADPFTRHAHAQPRGYPGDAALLDYIYEAGSHGGRPDAGSLGAQVYAHNLATPACAAVRWRKRLLSDRLRALPPTATALSLACGHLRECLDVVRTGGALPTVHGMDLDAASLAEARRSLAGAPVHLHQAGARALLKGTFEPALRELDFAWSAGLYDYLDAPAAAAVSAGLVDRVRVGGRVLVANFVPGIPDAGYMETFMRWQLVYRTEAELAATFADLGDSVSVQTWRGPFGNIAYAEATRRR